MKASFKELGLASLLRWGGTLLARAGHAAFATQLFRTADSLAPVRLPPIDYARALWQDGQYADAKLTLTKILARAPQHAEANNLLGVIFFEEARVLWQAGQYPDARLALTKILARTPHHAEANNLLGVMFFEEANMELAGHYFRLAIKARPDFAAPRNNLGNIHRAADELEEAALCYRDALGCDSDYVEALTNLGAVLNSKGDNLAAEEYCRKAIELAPEFAGAHCNLGNVLLALERGGEAIAAYREALRLQPDLLEALVNLALVLEDGSYLIGTIDYYEKQLLRQPSNHLPHVRIAQAFHVLHRWDDARERLERALELNSEAPDALYVLGVHYIHVGDARAAIDCLRRALAGGTNSLAQTGIAFDSLYLEDCSGEEIRAKYCHWAKQYLIRPGLVSPSRDRSHAKVRIGYVSRDFARHSVAFFLEPILKHHDQSRFEVFCYSTLIRGDDFTDRFRALASTWRDISTLPEKQVVALIKEDQIDILVDLAGHTSGNRLDVFACKPAPVQVTYLGHPTTTGLDAIDYKFGDVVTDPHELTADHYVERIWQLPGCFLTYQPPANAPAVMLPPVIAKGHITFGSFNIAAKINDGVIEVWAAILAAIPTSRLLLKSYAFASSHGRARIIDGFAHHAITPDRLELIDWRADLQSHLEMYSDLDIALDPFPYNGTTTSCEALWMGVPVICLEGNRHSARVGASLLVALGLQDLLAHDSAEYVRIAVELAGDPERMRALRTGMRDRMCASALLDHAGFTDRLEEAYRQMWRVYSQNTTESESAAAHEKPDAPPAEMFRLHIGGQEKQPRWKVLNIQSGPAVDYLGDIRDLSQFADQVCDEIYASHVLEHVAQDQVPVVLQGLFRILKPGGCLRLSVPDLEALCRMYMQHSDNPEVRVHVMRMMFGGQMDAHDYHKVGFDFEFLRAHLRRARFERIERVTDFNIFDDTSRYAPYGMPISLNVITYRPNS